MKLFWVKKIYNRTSLMTELSLKEGAVIKECESIREAVEETKTVTGDEMVVIFINVGEEKKLCVHTFGNFEVFYDGKPLAFTRAKSKELFAYLIDRRGAAVTTAEACGVLWEEKEYNFSRQRQFQTVVSELFKSLKTHRIEHLIYRRRNCLSVDVTGLECDYYRLLEGDSVARGQYSGEYMSNYSWAEMTAGFLSQKYGSR